jgi:hypothetical protein
MRHLLLKTSIALLCLILLAPLAMWIVPGSVLAQPARPTLTPARPTLTPAPTHKPDRKPTDTPIPTATEPPTATAAPAPTEAPTEAPTPTAVSAPLPAQLPTTSGGAADWSAALLLALLLLGMGAVLRPLSQTEDGRPRTKDK